MKFRYVRKVKGEAIGYQGYMLATGDEIELTGAFIQKAIANPDYEAVPDYESVKKSKKTSRKKVTRRG